MARRRLVIFILASIVWGALCTIGVGWFFAATAKPSYSAIYGNGFATVALNISGDAWDTQFLQRHPVYQGQAQTLTYQGTTGYMQRWYRTAFDPNDQQLAALSANIPLTMTTRCGWPWFAMEAEETELPTQPGQKSASSVEGGFLVAIPFWHNPTRAIPFQPMWPGFLFDTAIFTGTLPLIIFIFAFVRRSVRPRAGFCPRCRYPVGSSLRCTECGTMVVPSNAT